MAKSATQPNPVSLSLGYMERRYRMRRGVSLILSTLNSHMTKGFTKDKPDWVFYR